MTVFVVLWCFFTHLPLLAQSRSQENKKYACVCFVPAKGLLAEKLFGKFDGRSGILHILPIPGHWDPFRSIPATPAVI